MILIKKGVGKGGHKKSYLSNCTGAHSKKKIRNLIIIMKIISKGSIISEIIHNYTGTSKNMKKKTSAET